MLCSITARSRMLDPAESNTQYSTAQNTVHNAILPVVPKINEGSIILVFNQ